EPVTLGEGFTPLVHAQSLGASLGLQRLFIKDESLNPTNSFKARGQSAAITRAKYLGATTIALPTAGNAGNAAAAYSAAAGLAWVTAAKRPKMVSVQAEHCAPIVRAFEQGADRAQAWEGASTIADGLRVPRAIGDFLILRAIRESGGTAIAVSDESMVDAMLE